MIIPVSTETVLLETWIPSTPLFRNMIADQVEAKNLLLEMLIFYAYETK